MKKHVLGFGILVFLTSATIGMAVKQIQQDKEKAPATKSPPSVEETTPSQGQTESETPAVIKSPSSAGEVIFPHQKHIEDFALECKTCHHEINAAPLKFPHKDYFYDFWIDCKICHHESGSTSLEAQACSKCHHALPANIADETLSAKVVIHKNCWECHEAGKGAEASKNCKFCHGGPRMKF